MRIAVLGGGAMGALYGGYLSRKNDVLIVDVNTALIEKIEAEGLTIAEPDGSSAVYHPAITDDTKGMQPVDLAIVFVKAMFNRKSLSWARAKFRRNFANAAKKADGWFEPWDRSWMSVRFTRQAVFWFIRPDRSRAVWCCSKPCRKASLLLRRMCAAMPASSERRTPVGFSLKIRSKSLCRRCFRKSCRLPRY